MGICFISLHYKHVGIIDNFLYNSSHFSQNNYSTVIEINHTYSFYIKHKNLDISIKNNGSQYVNNIRDFIHKKSVTL